MKITDILKEIKEIENSVLCWITIHSDKSGDIKIDDENKALIPERIIFKFENEKDLINQFEIYKSRNKPKAVKKIIGL